MATDLQKLLQVARAAGMNLGDLGFKDGLPSGAPDTAQLHGPNGLFGNAGLEQQLISTHVHGRGLATELPSYATQTLWPQFGYITGFQDLPADFNPDGPCDDPPTVGHMKSCVQTAHFGLYSYRTREFNIKRAGELINRGEPTDLIIMNDPLLEQMSNITPNVPGVGGTPNMRREMLIRMMELGVAFQRKLGRQVYTGDPANATNGGYDEFPGLDILVSTGHIDAISQTTCPSLDSILADFAYQKVDASGGDTLLTLAAGIFRYLNSLAEDTGLDPVQFSMVMRRDLFYELTAIWPCVYMTHRCTFADEDGLNRNVVSANDMIAMRDDMRMNNYLMIDGAKIPVILDTYIPEEDWTDTGSIDTGCYASDIYIVPRTVAGNIVSLYWQYYDYMGQFGPMEAARDARVSNFFWTDSGRFFWEAMPPMNGCVVAEATIRPRLILRTPHLAARIQNVQYCPARHTRDVIPTDSFFVNGGVVGRTFTEPWSQWNPS